ncbi:hypothetical protein HPB49_013311 [Dermacentor silvarum]|uniref:Uncharacterized protein n=1 Tax=Dermacentor silvarum TaxID=543639 RepID=A0ACB8D5T7_DERSI|nr:hypothetical protein HPB49_013311 [Dermacentor silvarum]
MCGAEGHLGKTCETPRCERCEVYGHETAKCTSPCRRCAGNYVTADCFLPGRTPLQPQAPASSENNDCQLDQDELSKDFLNADRAPEVQTSPEGPRNSDLSETLSRSESSDSSEDEDFTPFPSSEKSTTEVSASEANSSKTTSPPEHGSNQAADYAAREGVDANEPTDKPRIPVGREHRPQPEQTPTPGTMRGTGLLQASGYHVPRRTDASLKNPHVAEVLTAEQGSSAATLSAFTAARVLPGYSLGFLSSSRTTIIESRIGLDDISCNRSVKPASFDMLPRFPSYGLCKAMTGPAPWTDQWNPRFHQHTFSMAAVIHAGASKTASTPRSPYLPPSSQHQPVGIPSHPQRWTTSMAAQQYNQYNQYVLITATDPQRSRNGASYDLGLYSASTSATTWTWHIGFGKRAPVAAVFPAARDAQPPHVEPFPRIGRNTADDFGLPPARASAPPARYAVPRNTPSPATQQQYLHKSSVQHQQQQTYHDSLVTSSQHGAMSFTVPTPIPPIPWSHHQPNGIPRQHQCWPIPMAAQQYDGMGDQTSRYRQQNQIQWPAVLIVQQNQQAQKGSYGRMVQQHIQSTEAQRMNHQSIRPPMSKSYDQATWTPPKGNTVCSNVERAKPEVGSEVGAEQNANEDAAKPYVAAGSATEKGEDTPKKKEGFEKKQEHDIPADAETRFQRSNIR